MNISKIKIQPRRATGTVRVGNTVIGGDNPVVIQSMTTTSTDDVEASVAQIKAIHDAGAPVVRLTAQGVAQARSLGRIKGQLVKDDVKVALVADIHFNPAAAFEAVKHVDKVRINPGNFADPARTFRKIDYTDAEYAAERERVAQAFRPFVDACRQYGRAMRIGVNHGSLSDRILSRYGNTVPGMVESAMEYLRVTRDMGFGDVVVSIKASNAGVMIDTVRAMARAMEAEGMQYPLHLGVTEAGAGEDGRIRSALGIGTLLADGLGDTIRVSLSEPPQAEVPVAKQLLAHIDKLRSGGDTLAVIESVDNGIYTGIKPFVVGLDVDSQPTGTSMARVEYPAGMSDDEIAIAASVDLGRALYGREDIQGIEIVAPGMARERLNDLALSILQAAGRRVSKTEFISCPGCGRTMFDLPGVVGEVKKRLSHLKGLKIAVMGCIVNGPGEMAGADYGYVGGARGKVSIYKGRERVVANVDEDKALDALIKVIKDNGDWQPAI